MERLATPIPDLILLKPPVFSDNRGDFFEVYNKETFRKIGIGHNFVQDNQSRSAKNVLRGLHFQVAPFEQGKLVRVVQGAVMDVAVDIRVNSKTYLRHFDVVLSDKNNLILWIPPGFAHGFLSLEDDTVVHYKCTQFYNKQTERGIIWNDKKIGIEWGIQNPILSEKDSLLPTLGEFEKSNS